MARVVFTPDARADLGQLRAFVGQDSPAAAKALARRIRREAARLGRYPRSGRVVPEFSDDNVRELIVPPYRIVYRLQADLRVVRVIGIVHGSRMMTTIDDRT